MTQHPDLFAALAAPFAAKEVKTRQQAGREFSYVTARTVMNRFDSVVGPENWWQEYEALGDTLLCKLSIRLPDGRVLTKQDAGGRAGMQDQGDDGKSGVSDAFKRAAVCFGCGRYLYRDGVADLYGEDGEVRPAQAAPEPVRDPEPRHNGHGDRHGNGKTNGNGNGDAGPPAPRNGRGFFAWVKEQEQKHEIVLLRYMNNWGKLHEFPARMVDWTGEQVAAGHAEAVKKMRHILNDVAEAEAEALAN